LLDFSSNKQPQLYFVENELATHQVYSHISEQIVRFSAAIKTSQNQIRGKLLELIKSNSKLQGEIQNYLVNTRFSNVDELMIFLVELPIKIVLVNEITTVLNDSLDVFKERPDVVTIKKYVHNSEIAYVYEPMREELQELEDKKIGSKKLHEVEFDTIVSPAFEDGFKHAYINNNAWWAIRISQKAREKLRYLAIYEKKPVMAVRHYATIDRIEPYKDSGKFIVHLKNKKTIQPIKLDRGKKGVAPQSSRFTTLNKLLSAKKLSDLWK